MESEPEKKEHDLNMKKWEEWEREYYFPKKMSEEEKAQLYYNAGVRQAQWQVTKAMLGLSVTDSLYAETKRLLKFIHDEIDKELK